MTSVKQLRQSGYKVRVYHQREKKGENISPLGGATKVEITTPDGKDLVGEAICSKRDNYNKKVGAAIAIGRALKNV
mgnify:CR=1 FL=1